MVKDLRDEEPVDTLKPQEIVEDEELERLSGLLQRDNLVRGLGIVEHVYRLLHCTPGTVGVVRPEQRGGGPAGAGIGHTLVGEISSFMLCRIAVVFFFLTSLTFPQIFSLPLSLSSGELAVLSQS